MLAMVTGASSGIGKDISIYLSKLGYDLILVARDKEKMEKISKSISTNVKIEVADLSNEKEILRISSIIEKEKIDLLVNNAGFGLFGTFDKTDLDTELNMIDLNIRAVHILTKEAVKFFKKTNSGYILNVASSAGLLPGGPLLNTYYATKCYVRSLSLAIYEELRRENSNVKISVLCPGPVKTEFNKRADVSFNIDSLDSKYVAKYAVDKMFKNKLIIVPGLSVKLGIFFSRFLSNKMLLKITYKVQERKGSSK